MFLFLPIIFFLSIFFLNYFFPRIFFDASFSTHLFHASFSAHLFPGIFFHASFSARLFPHIYLDALNSAFIHMHYSLIVPFYTNRAYLCAFFALFISLQCRCIFFYPPYASRIARALCIHATSSKVHFYSPLSLDSRNSNLCCHYENG